MPQLIGSPACRETCLVFVAALTLGSACAGSPPKAQPACQRQLAAPQRLLRFRHTLRFDAGALDAGKYRFVLAGESYAAACDVSLPSDEDKLAGRTEWTATCNGDDLEVEASFDHLFGLLVPARLTAVSVRVSRGDLVVLDSVVTPSTACGPDPLEDPTPSDAPDDPGELCLALDREATSYPRRVSAPIGGSAGSSSNPEGQCFRHSSGGPSRELFFQRPTKEWFNAFESGDYRFQVEGDRYAAQCTLLVPDDASIPAHCEGDQLDFVGDRSIQTMLVPARLHSVRVRITRSGATVFDGVITPSTSCKDPGAPRGSEGLCVSMAKTGL